MNGRSLTIDYAKAEAELEEIASKHRQAWRPWTNPEDELLLKFYRLVPHGVLAKKLDRNVTALASRVDKLRQLGFTPECDK